jgi:hypothetical protein
MKTIDPELARKNVRAAYERQIAEGVDALSLAIERVKASKEVKKDATESNASSGQASKPTLHGAAAAEIVQSLIDERLGPGVSFERIPTHLKDEVRLNSRVRGLDALRLSHSFGPKGDVSKDELLKALDRLGETMVILREYVVDDRQ